MSPPGLRQRLGSWLTFLSVGPSLDFIGVGADVDAGVDVGAGAAVD